VEKIENKGFRGGSWTDIVTEPEESWAIVVDDEDENEKRGKGMKAGVFEIRY
jgi:hypothetical protein